MKYAHPYRIWFLVGLGAMVGLSMLVHRLSERLPITVLANQTISVSGVERTYRLVLPNKLPLSSRVPLLVVLHGALDTVEQAAEYTDLDRLAAQHDLCLLYLQGWNDSWPPFIPEKHPEVVDRDIAFFDAACNRIESNYPIDPRRVYITGMSQGAAFLHVIVARRSERIAAAASHSGWLPDPLGETGVDTTHKCPVLFIVGKNDTQVSPESVAKAHDCFADAGHPTTMLQLEGVGHRWAKDRGINETIWQFLSDHELQ
jgi:polyhydroxybutyrate depolymerase